MADEATPLTDAERAELEQLRAEKAAREEEQRMREEREELERLRAERAQDKNAASRPATKQPDAASADELRVRAARERGRKLMEPDDDLSMPLGQKIVLIAVALIVLVIAVTMVFGPK